MIMDCNRWSTHWFQCDIEIPRDWKEKHVVLRWNSGGEAMVSMGIIWVFKSSLEAIH